MERTKDTVEDEALAFPVLSDAGNKVAKAFRVAIQPPAEDLDGLRSAGVDLSEHNGDRSGLLPIPATFLIDRAGVIRLAYVDRDYANRLELDEIVAALRGLKTGAPGRR